MGSRMNLTARLLQFLVMTMDGYPYLVSPQWQFDMTSCHGTPSNAENLSHSIVFSICGHYVRINLQGLRVDGEPLARADPNPSLGHGNLEAGMESWRIMTAMQLDQDQSKLTTSKRHIQT